MNAAELQTGDLVAARGREWIVLGKPGEGLVRVRPLSGSEEDAAVIAPALEAVPMQSAHFAAPTADTRDTQDAARLLADALRLSLRRGAGVVYSVGSNWKHIVQNYSECYHCAPVHPELVRFSPADSGRNDLSEGGILGGYMDLNESVTSLTPDGKTPRRPLPGVSGENLARVYYYALFPNLLLSLHPDYVMTHVLWPESPDRTAIQSIMRTLRG